MTGGRCDEIATYEGECEWGVMLVEPCAEMPFEDWCDRVVLWSPWLAARPRCARGREEVG